jgi:hypothetical protein
MVFFYSENDINHPCLGGEKNHQNEKTGFFTKHFLGQSSPLPPAPTFSRAHCDTIAQGQATHVVEWV